MNDENYIKINRNILNEIWFKNSNTRAVFLHLLLKANTGKTIIRDIEVPEGALITTYMRLSDELNLKVDKVKKAVKILVNNGKIKVNKYSKYIVISVNDFTKYMDIESKG